MKRSLARALAVSLLCLAAPGCSDDDDDVELLVPDGVVFADIDVDDDGVVTAAEWVTVRDAWDLDGDLVLVSGEWRFENGFVQIDVQADQIVTQAEWAAAFDTWDLDDDNVLIEAELDPYL